MPYVRFPDEEVHMWYRTNLPGDGDARFLDGRRPTIVLLHGVLTDSSFMDLQFDDPRLHKNYNMIAFDSRSTGRTQNPLDPSRDAWTEAADLAKAMNLLRLPPSHLFACSLIAQQTALRFMLLWPDLCISLTWVGVLASKEPVWASQAYREVVTAVMTAEDIESVEEVANGLMFWVFGENMPEERKDRFVEYMETQYTGIRTPRFYDYHMILLHRTALDKSKLALIKQPVLFIQSTDSPIYPTADSAALRDHGVTGAKLHVINGPAQVHTVPPYSESVNTLFLQFLDTEAIKTVICPHFVWKSDFMEVALSRLARLSGNEAFAARDPKLSGSFSLIPDAIRAERGAILDTMSRISATKKPHGILDQHGVPLRKFSERFQGELFLRQRRGRPLNCVAAVKVTVQEG